MGAKNLFEFLFYVTLGPFWRRRCPADSVFAALAVLPIIYLFI